jgi:hypothetical protein
MLIYVEEIGKKFHFIVLQCWQDASKPTKDDLRTMVSAMRAAGVDKKVQNFIADTHSSLIMQDLPMLPDNPSFRQIVHELRPAQDEQAPKSP